MRRATGALVDADGLELRTGEGPVFSRIGFTAEPGSLTVFEADAGGGRTALLLALGGRMRPTSGALRVDGYELPRQARRARRIAALALASGVNDLDERLRVSEHMAERLLLRFRPAPASVSEPALAEAGLAGLDLRTLVKDLSALERRRLGVALALLEEPRLLLVDDADAGLGERNRRAFWSLLRDLAGTGLTVIAACADARGAGDGVAVHPVHRPPRRARAVKPLARSVLNALRPGAQTKGRHSRGGDTEPLALGEIFPRAEE
ncbi:ATP-binding cassette domain-containing protein [Nocardiopsis composta]|uniref:ABC-type multidrug transport system ATPase subunit n=1 Tax=Nocardiopsis composta TaxID=157465 RepID=A0A7W8QML0_9ACTN|nr:ATP-binding cassette domain-containing protein [Nocardiopsis composta]MBB5432764.1 ABC-type multidrug transport system ATPase subunit [Nocardiopsis composta]